MIRYAGLMKHKTILFFVSLDRSCFNEQLGGIFRYSHAKNWHVQVVSDAFSRAEILKTLEFWNPAGVIVECGDALKVPPTLFNGIPTVCIGIGRRRSPSGFNSVEFDSSSAGKMGAEYLLGLNLPTYAYVGFGHPMLWDRDRMSAFAETVRKAGRRVEMFPTARSLSTAERRDRLLAWIKGLPRPCGLMACNDSVGEEVLSICARIGICVPDEISVVGVDNDVTLCENTSPPLASIDPGADRCGFYAAQILDRQMSLCSGCVADPVHMRTLPVRLVTRQSARPVLCDRSKLSEALEMIRCRAYEGIGVSDVVAEMGVSRRVAEKHFRLATGKSILEEILDRRFEKVFEMLRKPKQRIGSIAGLCGFSSEVALRKAFRLRTGMSMRAWRDGNALG